MESLERAMADQREVIERELEKAEAELAELRERQARLEDLIRRARIYLGKEADGQAPGEFEPLPADGYLPLHEALARILRKNGNRVMSARELADEVNRTGLYHKRDGSPVEGGQIHARVHNYDRLFVRAGGGIQLRDVQTPAVSGDVEKRFDDAMLDVYASAMREVGYSARRFLAMVRGRGGLEAARQLLAKAGVSEGFRRLAEAKKLRLTMEYQVLMLEFAPLFTDLERHVARTRLLDFGMAKSDLPG
jgi:hypothetical protein